MKEIDYSILPEHMRDGMQMYVEDRVRPGDFLYLILCNDFVHALGHADQINTARIVDYAKFLYLEAPRECWGSREKVDAWIKAHEITKTATVTLDVRPSPSFTVAEDRKEEENQGGKEEDKK